MKQIKIIITIDDEFENNNQAITEIIKEAVENLCESVKDGTISDREFIDGGDYSYELIPL